MRTLFDTLIPHAAVDVVAVFDQDFRQVFPRARALKAVVKEPKKVMKHPTEFGTTIADHQIIDPVEISLSFVLQSEDYQDTYREIKQYSLNATLLVVQTRSGLYYNQLISNMPHEEDPEQYDTLAMALTFTEVQFVTPVFTVRPRRPSHQSTVSRGEIQPTPPPAQGTALTDIRDWIRGRAS